MVTRKSKTCLSSSFKSMEWTKHISGIKKGNKSNRIGRIVNIDIENNAASVKIEILMPTRKRKYTDYLLLLKYQGEWKITQKSFT